MGLSREERYQFDRLAHGLSVTRATIRKDHPDWDVAMMDAVLIAVNDHLTACESLLREMSADEYQNMWGDYVISEDDWHDWKSRIAALLGPAE